MKPPLLHIIDSLGVGGAEKLLVGIINDLKGYEHHLIVLRGPETLRTDITASCHFLNLNCSSFSQLFYKSRIARKYIREHKIRLVHSHLYEANLLARLATPRSVPLVNSIHAISSLASYKINKVSLYLEKVSYKKRHVLLAVSKAVLDDFEEWVGVKGESHVLYNFIEDRFFLPHHTKDNPAGSLKLVAVGNLRWQKNYPYLVEAFKKMPAGVSLDIYGQGDLRDSLQEEIDKHKLNIRLLGVRNNLEEIFPTYDAFIMSSFYEGQPLSLLEATASGLPALLSDIPVLREVLGDDAIYFDIKDPQSLVNVVSDMLAQKYNLNKLAEAGIRKVNSFARKHYYMEKLSGIYNECMD